jgi:hypothetical protein
MAAYAALDPIRVIDTIEKLRARITERFPSAGLEKVCIDLGAAARRTSGETNYIQAPNILLRGGVALVMALGLFLMIGLARVLRLDDHAPGAVDFVQGVEAVLNIVLLAGAGIAFLLTLETRLKRARAIAALQELRGLVHVIDMHQLTKDPGMIGGARTSASPDRDLTAFELSRYLDYCSEMLSLAAKIAALYAQAGRDSQIEEAASDLERLCASLSQKIWQKITILRTAGEAPAA